jgi:hypothetical protein
MSAFCAPAEIERPELDVLEHGRPDKLIVGILEQQTDIPPSLGERCLVTAGMVHQDDITREVIHEAERCHQQCRLTHADTTSNNDAFAIANVQTDAIEDGSASPSNY